MELQSLSSNGPIVKVDFLLAVYFSDPNNTYLYIISVKMPTTMVARLSFNFSGN